MAKKKSTPKKKFARARLTLPKPPQFANMVATCKQQVATAQKCADYPNQPAVQTAASAVLADANALDKTLTDIANTQALLAQLEDQRDEQVAVTQRDHDTLEAAINTASQGDAQAILKWGGQVEGRVPATPSTDPPLNPAIKTTNTPGSVTLKCKADKRAYSYAYQTGTDPAHPETWPAPVVEGGSSYTISGLTIGQKLYGRIAILRRGTGQGQWSGILEVTVR